MSDILIVKGQTYRRYLYRLIGSTLDYDFLPATGPNADIYAITSYEDPTTGKTYMVVGGAFTSFDAGPGWSHVARWDGTTWTKMGAGFNGDVYALTVHKGVLYAGGFFTAATGIAATAYIAKWDDVNQKWASVNANQLNSYVQSITSVPDREPHGLFLTGGFTLAGATVMRYIGYFDAVAGVYSEPFSGANNVGYQALAITDSKIVYSGAFTDNAVGGFGGTLNYLAWDDLDSPGSGGPIVTTATLNDGCWALCKGPQENYFYAGGLFDTDLLVAAGDRLVTLMYGTVGGMSWVEGSEGGVWWLHNDNNGKIYAGMDDAGYIGGYPAIRLSLHEDARWKPAGSGVDAPVYAIHTIPASLGGGVMIGGAFIRGYNP